MSVTDSLLEALAPPALDVQVDREGDTRIFTFPPFTFTVRVTPQKGDYALFEVGGGYLDFSRFERLDITSGASRDRFVKKLRDLDSGLPWDRWIEHVCLNIYRAIRAGAPFVPLMPQAPRPVQDLIPGLLPLAETTLLHADGESGKSLFGLTIALACTTDTTLLGGLRATRRCSVLYLDTETNEETHKERLHMLTGGLRIAYDGGIFYHDLGGRNVADEAGAIREEIARLQIGLVILDSLAPAALGSGEQWHETAIRAFNVLRTFAPATRLVLAHHPSDSERPFGGVFVKNMPRAEWMITRDKDEDELTGNLSMGFYNRKFNDGRHARPFGWQYTFAYPNGRDTRGVLTGLRPYDLKESPELSRRLSLSQQALNALRAGPLWTSELADLLKTSPANTRQYLNRHANARPPRTVRVEEDPRKGTRWGLAHRGGA